MIGLNLEKTEALLTKCRKRIAEGEFGNYIDRDPAVIKLAKAFMLLVDYARKKNGAWRSRVFRYMDGKLYDPHRVIDKQQGVDQAVFSVKGKNRHRARALAEEYYGGPEKSRWIVFHLAFEDRGGRCYCILTRFAPPPSLDLIDEMRKAISLEKERRKKEPRATIPDIISERAHGVRRSFGHGLDYHVVERIRIPFVGEHLALVYRPSYSYTQRGYTESIPVEVSVASIKSAYRYASATKDRHLPAVFKALGLRGDGIVHKGGKDGDGRITKAKIEELIAVAKRADQQYAEVRERVVTARETAEEEEHRKKQEEHERQQKLRDARVRLAEATTECAELLETLHELGLNDFSDDAVGAEQDVKAAVEKRKQAKADIEKYSTKEVV